jgi:hypothetical protein
MAAWSFSGEGECCTGTAIPLNILIIDRLPIYYHGRLIGGVGVSGGTVPQDVEVATAALAGIGASATASM